jgi:chitinase
MIFARFTPASIGAATRSLAPRRPGDRRAGARRWARGLPSWSRIDLRTMALAAAIAMSGGALAPAPVRADDQLAIRINDAEGSPGGLVDVVVRSYAPRAIGQGQFEVRSAPRPRSLAGIAAQRATSRASAASPRSDSTSPFVALESFELFSQAGDHTGNAALAADGAASVSFLSPSASINRGDGPIAILHLRLASDLAIDSEYELDLDLGVSFLIGEHGESIPIDPRPGRLRIRQGDATPPPSSPGTLGFDGNNLTLPESVGFALVTVERRGGSQGAASVAFHTAGGTATEGRDYLAASGVLSWASGESGPRTFVVELLDDGVVESAETVRLELSDVTGATLDAGASAVDLLIGDDDSVGTPAAGRIGFDQRSYVATEEAGVAVITVVRSGGTDGAVSVAYETSAGSADDAADYDETSGTLDWAAGESGARSFLVPIVHDALAEDTETVHLLLFAPGGGAALDPVGADAVLSILDAQASPPLAGAGKLGFTAAEFDVLEGAGQATVSVGRTGGIAGAVSVRYRLEDGAAIDGADYTRVTGMLAWADGEGGAKSFTVPIVQDALHEGNELALLELSDPTGGAAIDAGAKSALLLIVDDDAPIGACAAGGETLCLAGGRFRVEARFRTATGSTGAAHAVIESDSSGLLWFFQPTNMEILVKVLDACSLPAFESYWVFFSATTNVDFTLVVTDTVTGLTREYVNPLGRAAVPVQDTTTFRVCR